MAPDDLNLCQRQEFECDAFSNRASRVDEATAWKLVRIARLGIQLSQDPVAELTFYAERIARICVACPVDPEAFLAFEALLDDGMRPQTEDPFVHAVRKGQTLSALAERFGCEVGALIAANPLVARTQTIFPGMRLLIPNHLTYVVQRGECLESVSEALTEYVRCFDGSAVVTPDDLRRRNELLSDMALEQGRALAWALPRFE